MEKHTYSTFDFIVKNSQEQKDTIFIEDDDGRKISYDDFRLFVTQTAYELSQLGIKKGSYVSLHCVRDVRLIIVECALFLLSAVAVLVPQLESPSAFLSKTTFDYLPHYYVGSEGNELALFTRHGILLHTFSFAKDPSKLSFGEELNQQCDIYAPSLMLFTSGSTGKSKGVLLSQANFLANYYGEGNIFGERKDDRCLSFLPLQHIFAFVGFINAIVNGHYVYFMKKPHAYEMLEAIQEKKITIVYAVPSIFHNMAKSQEENHYDLSSLRYGLVSGAPASLERLRWIESTLACPLLPVYGMSEALGITTFLPGEEEKKRWSFVGKVSPFNEIKIAQNGEILVKGETLMLGYAYGKGLYDPSRDSEGYFHTGDLGQIDADGYLTLLGRIKDIIIRGGENISPRKVETALTSIPEIDQAAVVGVKDSFFGEIVGAAIIFKEGCTLTQEEIKERLRLFLVKFELPEKFLFLDSFPLTPTNKVDKEKLKQMLA